jgi:P2 family phage major capsid protein
MSMKALSALGYDRFSRYLENVARANELSETLDPMSLVARNFNVTPSLQQVLADKLTEDTSWLGNINIALVDEMKGEKLGLGLDGKIVSSRTDTNLADRATKSVWYLDSNLYETRDTHFDTNLTYHQIDFWAKFPDFEARIARHLLEAQRADRIKIGFNGTSHAANTNRDLNPLGQDVNIGWLERMRISAPENVLDNGADPAKVTFGSHATADFKTLDALVVSAVNEMISPWHRQRTDLVVLVSNDLLEDKYFDQYNIIQPPSEQLAAQAIDLQRRIGRHQAKVVPWFPAGAVFVTFEKNLSIYEQSGSRRRSIKDEAKRSRFENYESFNEDYVVEDYDAAVLIEKIEEKNAA